MTLPCKAAKSHAPSAQAAGHWERGKFRGIAPGTSQSSGASGSRLLWPMVYSQVGVESLVSWTCNSDTSWNGLKRGLIKFIKSNYIKLLLIPGWPVCKFTVGWCWLPLGAQHGPTSSASSWEFDVGHEGNDQGRACWSCLCSARKLGIDLNGGFPAIASMLQKGKIPHPYQSFCLPSLGSWLSIQHKLLVAHSAFKPGSFLKYFC